MEKRQARSPGRSRSRRNGAGANDHGLPHLIDTATLAEHLGVDPRTVRRWAADGRVPYYQPGGSPRYDPVEVLAWLEKSRAAVGRRHATDGRSEARP